jgi:zinc protease
MRFYTYCFISFLVALGSQSAFAEIKPKQIDMKNGLTLLLIERHSLPIVSVEVLIKSGSANDPPDLAGVANLTASLLDEGTQKRNSAQMAEEAEFVGASLSASADVDYTTVNLRVLKKDITLGFDLLSDALLNPIFDANELERVRRLILGSILSEKDEPTVIASRAFDNIVFANHPYKNPVIGLEGTVQKITRDDITAFYKKHYLPKNALFTIVGDVTEKEAVSLVKKYFSGWKGSSSIVHKTDTPKIQPTKTELINKDLTQTTVIMGHLGISRKHPDFYPITVMNYILGGGGFASRLLTHIRDNKGLVYSAHSAFNAGRQRGSFEIALQTKPGNTNEAISAALQEIALIRKEGVTETELSEAKAYLIGSFPLRLETTGRLAGLLSKVGFHKLGLAYFTDYPKYIEKVTREDVLRVAKTRLNPDQMSLVVVGNLAESKVNSIFSTDQSTPPQEEASP